MIASYQITGHLKEDLDNKYRYKNGLVVEWDMQKYLTSDQKLQEFQECKYIRFKTNYC